MGGQAARFTELADGSIEWNTSDNWGGSDRFITVMRQIDYEGDWGVHSVSLSYWVEYEGVAVPRWFKRGMSLDEFLRFEPDWEPTIREAISKTPFLFGDVVYTPDPHPGQPLLDELIASGEGGTRSDSTVFTRIYHRMAQSIEIALFICILALLALAMARRWFEGMVIRRHKRLEADTCPSCEYPSPGAVCPECGIDMKQERIIVQALYQRGYRGLQQLGQPG